MPTVGIFHTQYWEFSDTSAAPIHVGKGGYPAWQASVITPSLFGIVGAWIDTYWALLKWHWTIATRLHHLSAESRGVVVQVIDTLESPVYPKAQAAVRQTSHTLGFNRPEAWKDLARHMKADAGRTENVYRRLNACRLLRETAGSTLTTPEQNLMTELAYVGYAWTHR